MEYTVENTVPDAYHTTHTNFTPRARGRRQFSLGVTLAPEAEDGTVDLLEELLNQTWTIFGVSTLFNFHPDDVHLKQYAKRLREEVATSLEQEDVIYNANISIMKDVIIRPSPTDPVPIKIEVYSQNSNKESTEKCIYKGIFISWRTTKDDLNTANSLRLPLLLCRGAKNAIRIVHYAFFRMFDCMIIELPVKEDDLIWLVPILITPANLEEQPKGNDQIYMEYRIPELPASDTITIKLKILDLLKVIMILLKDQTSNGNIDISFNLEHIEKFRDILYTQMLETAGIQLGLCTLYKIRLPAFTIMENRMKVMNTEVMNRILLYLNEKALDTFHALSFVV